MIPNFAIWYLIFYIDIVNDFVSIGNISIDLFYKGESFTFKDSRFQLAIGGKYLAEHFYTGIGGGGANVAIGVSRKGLKTAVYGTIGDNPFRHILFEKLNKERVSYSHCPLVPDYFNISSILLTESGERTIIHFANPHQDLFGDTDLIKQVIKSPNIYLGNLENVSLTQKEAFISLAKRNGRKVIINLGVHDCRKTKAQLEPFLKHIDILVVNGHEFAELVKAPYKDIHFHENVVSWYIPQLSEKVVIITEGAKGSYGYEQRKVYHQAAVKVDKVIDTTGAGDAYTAGFLASYIKEYSIEKAMLQGASYASIILQRVGAT